MKKYKGFLGRVRSFSAETKHNTPTLWILVLISPRLWILIVQCQSGLKVRIKTDMFQELGCYVKIEVRELICFVFTLLV